ncbi:hypothetical protein [Sphingobium sp.]|uniref:hypothetical protein n=1 Tax=Sphingobium sp. TaxID=1912891 RepID=UPI0026260303|nr:hypothetical protein [Sphingobium sp.]
MNSQRSNEERLVRCWMRGDSIRTTMQSLKKTAGVTLDFETVRLVFVDLSEKFTGSK